MYWFNNNIIIEFKEHFGEDDPYFAFADITTDYLSAIPTISSGDDMAKFKLNNIPSPVNKKQLSWKSGTGFVPDYENPQDSNSDNDYEFVVSATLNGNTTNVNVTRKVTDDVKE